MVQQLRSWGTTLAVHLQSLCPLPLLQVRSCPVLGAVRVSTEEKRVPPLCPHMERGRGLIQRWELSKRQEALRVLWCSVRLAQRGFGSFWQNLTPVVPIPDLVVWCEEVMALHVPRGFFLCWRLTSQWPRGEYFCLAAVTVPRLGQ